MYGLFNEFSKSHSFILSNGTSLLTQLEASNLAFITAETISKYKKNSFIW